MKFIALLMVVGLSLVACNKAEEGHAEGDKKDDKKAEEKKDEKKADAGGSIGVKECDDYLTKLESCLKDLPAAAKPAMEESLKMNREAWTEAAKTPEAKAALQPGCKAALDALAATCK